MKQITTHKGDTILLIEVPLDAKDFSLQYNAIDYWIDLTPDFVEVDEIDLWKKYQIIGTTSTLTDKDVEPFVKKKKAIRNYSSDDSIEYEVKWDYLEQEYSICSDSYIFKTMLQHNEIDLSKEWVVLKIKND
jgi:hypothetical protein